MIHANQTTVILRIIGPSLKLWSCLYQAGVEIMMVVKNKVAYQLRSIAKSLLQAMMAIDEKVRLGHSSLVAI